MNTTLAVIQINGALNALRAIQGSAGDLPQRAQNKIAGLAHLATVIHGLELAKAELTGQPHPPAPVSTTNFDDLDGIIDA